MSARKTADQWFAEYGDSHQDHTNELIHWICVPVIFFCVLGFIWEIPVPEAWEEKLPWFNWTLVSIESGGVELLDSSSPLFQAGSAATAFASAGRPVLSRPQVMGTTALVRINGSTLLDDSTYQFQLQVGNMRPLERL